MQKVIFLLHTLHSKRFTFTSSSHARGSHDKISTYSSMEMQGNYNRDDDSVGSREDSLGRPRKDSTENTRSRLPRLFLNDETRAELLQWIVRAMANKRVLQKVDGSYHSIVLEHAWIFMFIDIIYVGTIFKISHLIGLCGTSVTVYILCASYFAIMFSSRLSFDVYTCVSGASGILHVIAFCFYGMGVFIMTVNISSRLKSSSGTDDHGGGHRYMTTTSSHSSYIGEASYGSCERSVDYDTAFAVAFIFTRVVLVIMYALYFYVFHESNLVGVAPDIGDEDLRLSDLTRDGDAEDVIAFKRSVSISSNHEASVDHKLTPKLGPVVGNPLNQSHTTQNNGNTHANTKANASSTVPHSHAPHGNDHGHGHGKHTAAAPVAHTNSFVMRVTRAYGATATKLHFNRIFILKVSPAIFSSLVMLTMFFGVSPVLVLPLVAISEIGGDFLPSLFIRHFADWKEMNLHRHFAEERLGLFFMLVLGEAVLGFSSVNYFSEDLSSVYKVILFSFFCIFCVGLQYFEPLQSYIKPEGPHPLDIQALNPVYVWFVCLASFFMLIAGNGMVELYGEVAGNSLINISHEELIYQKKKVSIGLGTVSLLIVLIKILDKVYYRERLLPNPFFNWLDGFYRRAEEDEKLDQQANLAARNAAARRQSLSQDAEFGDLVSASRAGAPPAQSEEAERRQRASSISSLYDTSFNHRKSFRVVPKEEMAMGIRRIRPLTVLKIGIAILQYVFWSFDIPTQDFMVYNAAFTVFPSLVEVVLELRNFFRKQRDLQAARGVKK